MPSGSRGWSVAAGGYAACCAAVVLLALSPIATTLASLLDLSGRTAPLVFAAPVVAVGAAVWWLLVERVAVYTPLRGIAAGVATAVLSVTVWVLVFAARFGLPLVRRGDVVVGFLLAIAVVVGIFQGVTAIYARGRLAKQPDGTASSASQPAND